MGAAEAKPESKLVFPIDLIAFYKLSKSFLGYLAGRN